MYKCKLSFLFFFICLCLMHMPHSGYTQKLKNKLDSVKYELKSLEAENLLIQANLCKNNKDFSQALELYYDAYSLIPQSSVALYEIAGIYKSQTKYNDALKVIKKAIEKNPQQIDYHYFLAEIYSKKGNYEKQIEELQYISHIEPQNLKILYEISEIYNSNYQYDKSLQILKKIENKYGTNEELLQKKFRVYNALKDYANAEIQIQDLIQKYPYKDEYSMLLASFYIQNGKYKQALELCNSMIPKVNNASDIYMNKAFIFAMQESVDSLEIELNHIFGSPYINDSKKGEILQQLVIRNQGSEKIFDKRFQIVENLHNTYPQNEQLHAILADYYVKNKDNEKALPHLYSAIKNENTNVSTYNQLIQIEQKNSNWDSVVSVCNQALITFPNNAEFYLLLGNANIQKHQYLQAINILQEGLEMAFLKKQKLSFYTILGEAYFFIDSVNTSDNYFNKALQIDSLNIFTLSHYAYILALRNQEQSKAQKMVDYCLLQDSLYYDIIVIQAILYSNQNKNEAALLEIEKVHSKLETPIFYEHYGDILFKNSKNIEAETAWNRANELGGDIDIQRKKVFLQKK